jgi:hypothetical protein
MSNTILHVVQGSGLLACIDNLNDDEQHDTACRAGSRSLACIDSLNDDEQHDTACRAGVLSRWRRLEMMLLKPR